jgi:non-heme chloroperoxidase
LTAWFDNKSRLFGQRPSDEPILGLLVLSRFSNKYPRTSLLYRIEHFPTANSRIIGAKATKSMTPELQCAHSFHVSPFMRVFAIAGLCILGSSAPNAIAPETTTWRDPSPHHITFVTVDKGVQLEVLDWGGTGRAVVLLAGYQTAHIYDDIAPKLTAFCHVYGITRRGFGASSRPDSGYTAQRSAEDVLQVLDVLKLNHPVLAGHSFGGLDLLTIAAQNPTLVPGLVFLDSGDDPTLPFSAYGVAMVDTKKLPASMTAPEPPSSNSSFQAFRESQLKAHGVMMPEAELRQRYPVNVDGSIGDDSTPKWVRDAIFAGIQEPRYSSIRVPVLAILAVPLPLDEQFNKYQPRTADERAAMEQKYAVGEAFTKRTVQDLQVGGSNAKIVTLPGASTYIFLSNENDTVRAMRSFIVMLN